MNGAKKKPSLMVAFGLGKDAAPEDDEAPESSEDETGSDDAVKQACAELWEALGVKPKDEMAACDALVALVDLRIHSGE